MDLAFLSGSRVGTRRSVLALQSTPRRAKKWFSVVPLCLMPWRIGRGYLHRYSRYFWLSILGDLTSPRVRSRCEISM
jgi:hypothetical protein